MPSHLPQHEATPKDSRSWSSVSTPQSAHWRISRSVTALQMQTYIGTGTPVGRVKLVKYEQFLFKIFENARTQL